MLNHLTQRDFIAKVTISIFFIFSLSVSADVFETTTTQKKVFKQITERQYREQIYKQTALTLVSTPIIGNQGPDRALLNVLSAMNAQDFDWWSDLWDHATKSTWVESIKKSQPQTEELKHAWSKEFQEKDVFLSRWIECREFVLVTYKLKNKKQNEPLSEEKGLIFVLEGGLWKATNKFDGDPFVTAVLKGQNSVDILVR